MIERWYSFNYYLKDFTKRWYPMYVAKVGIKWSEVQDNWCFSIKSHYQRIALFALGISLQEGVHTMRKRRLAHVTLKLKLLVVWKGRPTCYRGLHPRRMQAFTYSRGSERTQLFYNPYFSSRNFMTVNLNNTQLWLCLSWEAYCWLVVRILRITCSIR